MAGIRKWAHHDATIIRVKTRASYVQMYKNGDMPFFLVWAQRPPSGENAVPLPVYYDFGNGRSATNISLIILLSFYLWR